MNNSRPHTVAVVNSQGLETRIVVIETRGGKFGYKALVGFDQLGSMLGGLTERAVDFSVTFEVTHENA